MAIVGDEDAVAAQIGVLAEAGVTDFVAVEYTGGPDGARTRAFLRTLVTPRSVNPVMPAHEARCPGGARRFEPIGPSPLHDGPWATIRRGSGHGG